MARHVREQAARFVSVEEAARILGISRATAYKEARRFLETGVGLCCVRIGNRILVPIAWLDAKAAVGTDTWMPAAACLPDAVASRDASRPPALPGGAALTPSSPTLYALDPPSPAKRRAL